MARRSKESVQLVRIIERRRDQAADATSDAIRMLLVIVVAIAAVVLLRAWEIGV